MKKLIVLTIFLLVGVGVAYADDQSISIHSGWQHTASSAYEDARTISARYEHRLYKNFWLAPEYTYHGSMSHNANDYFNYGSISGHSVLLDLIYYPERLKIKKLQPYLIAGAGWSWWNFDESEQVKDLGITVDLGNAFAYKFGLGATYPFNKNINLFIEWSFFKSDVPKDAKHADGTYSALLGDDRASGRERIGEEETRLTMGVRF